MKRFSYVLFLLAMAVLKADAAPKPNILWIVTDDQRSDSIAAFNQMMRGKEASPLGKVLSPNVDRLASMGTTFLRIRSHEN